MAYTCVYDGMVISEGKLEKSVAIAEVSVDLSFRIGAQLKSLRDVKEKLVREARVIGANALENFTYGQKHRFLAIDDVAFWGRATAVRIHEDRLIAEEYLYK